MHVIQGGVGSNSRSGLSSNERASKKPESPHLIQGMSNGYKRYPAPWNGSLILACRKCQKKLKGSVHLYALARVKKTIKQNNKKHPEQALHVINVPCMDLCPKDGVTVCDVRESGTLRILWNEVDVARLHR